MVMSEVRYHASGTVCKATKRECPLGEDSHYNSPEAVVEANAYGLSSFQTEIAKDMTANNSVDDVVRLMKEDPDALSDVLTIRNVNTSDEQLVEDDEDWSIRATTVVLGGYAGEYVNDKVPEVRQEVARYGGDALRDRLIDDEDAGVRKNIAIYGNDQHRNYLINDRDRYVCAAIAQYGNDEQREKLIDKRSALTAVAQYGSNEQRERLLNDEVPYVRREVARYGSNKQREKLIDDSDYMVREVVAECGTDKQRAKLINDKDWQVRSAVAKNGNKSQCKVLLNDSDPIVVRSARARMRELS